MYCFHFIWKNLRLHKMPISWGKNVWGSIMLHYLKWVQFSSEVPFLSLLSLLENLLLFWKMFWPIFRIFWKWFFWQFSDNISGDFSDNFSIYVSDDFYFYFLTTFTRKNPQKLFEHINCPSVMLIQVGQTNQIKPSPKSSG